MLTRTLSMAAMMVGLAWPAVAAEAYVVAPASIADEKAVFATVEAPKPTPARVRTGERIAS